MSEKSFLQVIQPSNPIKGIVQMHQDCELLSTYAFVLGGNIARWIWLWAEAQLTFEIQQTQQSAMAGVPGLFFSALLPRTVISLIISAIVVAAFWPRMKNLDDSYRKWVAFAFGFFAEPTVGFLGQLYQLILGGF